MKVAKFGGSSMSNEEQFRKVKSIILSGSKKRSNRGFCFRGSERMKMTK